MILMGNLRLLDWPLLVCMFGDSRTVAEAKGNKFRNETVLRSLRKPGQDVEDIT